MSYLDSKRIVGTNSQRTGSFANITGGWKEVGRTTLGSSGDTIDVTSLPDKRYYMVLYDGQPSGSIDATLRLNSDTGNNYGWRYSYNGGTDSSGTSKPFTLLGGSAVTTPQFAVGHLSNVSNKEKLLIGHAINQNTAGSGNAPNRREQVGKWANTSNVISTITAYNAGTGDFASGSEVVVLGYDPDDTHTDNFWEELASVELSSAGDNLSSGTFTAKKYLWIQVALKNTGGNINMKLTCNNDTGSNYARRYSNNGAADSTQTSETEVQLNSGNNFQFYNIFMINNSANEKLGIVYSVDINTAGAGTAPIRSERVFKWANTSAQITEIDIDNTSTGNYDTGSIIKVWGAD